MKPWKSTLTRSENAQLCFVCRCLIADHSRRGTGLALLVQLQPQLFGHDRLVAGSPDTASIDSAAESISGNSLGHHTVDVLADSAFVALIQSCLVRCYAS